MKVIRLVRSVGEAAERESCALDPRENSAIKVALREISVRLFSLQLTGASLSAKPH